MSYFVGTQSTPLKRHDLESGDLEIFSKHTKGRVVYSGTVMSIKEAARIEKAVRLAEKEAYITALLDVSDSLTKRIESA